MSSQQSKSFKNDNINKHPVFHRDVLKLKNYVYKKVTVLTLDGREHNGWVYTVDPVSERY